MSRHTPLYMAVLFLTSACGGGGAAGSGTTPAPAAIASGYDIAAKVAEIRAYGTDWTAPAPNAPNGLELPAPPSLAGCGGALTPRNVSTIADVNLYAAGTCNLITLAPGTYTGGTGIVVSGQDIRLVLSGVTYTPPDQSYALNITQTARRVEVTAADSAQATLNNGWAAGQAVLGYAQDIKLKNLRFIGQDVVTSLSSADINGAYIKAHRLAVERVYCHLAGGCFFTADGSTNIIAANSEFYVHVIPGPFAAVPGMSGIHENPNRFNGTHLGVVMDTRLYAEAKHTLRAHGQSGTIGWFRNQSERGGIQTQQVPGTLNPQAAAVYLTDWRLYRPSGMGNNLLAMPRDNGGGEVATGFVYMTGNISYSAPHEGVAGAGLLPTGPGSPDPSWTTIVSAPTALANGNVYATYTAPPAWNFQ